MRNRRRGKVGHMAVKLDISKAYDWVEWEFLQRIMLKLGLSKHWVNLSMELSSLHLTQCSSMASPRDLLSCRRASDKGTFFPCISFFYVLRAYFRCWDRWQRWIRCKEYFPVEGESISLTSNLWMTASYFAKLHVRNVSTSFTSLPNMKKPPSKPSIDKKTTLFFSRNTS